MRDELGRDIPWWDVDDRLWDWLFPEHKVNVAAAFPWGLALLAAYLVWSKKASRR
jgi:hypothetical protein